jgi:hypothetical protein
MSENVGVFVGIEDKLSYGFCNYTLDNFFNSFNHLKAFFPYYSFSYSENSRILTNYSLFIKDFSTGSFRDYKYANNPIDTSIFSSSANSFLLGDTKLSCLEIELLPNSNDFNEVSIFEDVYVLEEQSHLKNALSNKTRFLGFSKISTLDDYTTANYDSGFLKTPPGYKSFSGDISTVRKKSDIFIKTKFLNTLKRFYQEDTNFLKYDEESS